MTIVAEIYQYVIGVDTHARTHTYAIINSQTGARTSAETFPVTASGINRAIAWIRRNTHGAILAAVEGTNSYGASLCHALTAENIFVVEAKPPKRPARAGRGKSDEIDAAAAAMSVLAREIATLVQPRSEGIRTAISVLLATRRRVEQQRTANRNALNALVRQVDLGLDTRKAVTDRQVTLIAGWRSRSTDTIDQAIGRTEAVALAEAIIAAGTRLKQTQAQLAAFGDQLAPGLQAQPGFGPVTVGIILAAYSHPGWLRSEAAFAALAGVAPLQASSGNTVRHRLNRHGDRQLNMALDIIAMVRMRCHDQTRAYVAKRTAQGRSYREIKRCLKRYLARSIFRQLQHLMI